MTVSASGTSSRDRFVRDLQYDANMQLIATGSGQVTNAVTAGVQYFAQISANSAAVDVNFANSIDPQTLLDANQDGVRLAARRTGDHQRDQLARIAPGR